MNKLLIIGVIIISIIISMIIFIFCYANYNVKDKGGMENENMKQFALEKVTYSISGDSIGYFVLKEIQHFENYDLLTVTSRASLNAKSVTKEYILPEDTLLKFTNVISKYNYKNWENLPQSDIYALDTGIHAIIIQLSNDEIYSINKNKVLPQNEENLFETVIEFLNKNIENNF